MKCDLKNLMFFEFNTNIINLNEENFNFGFIQKNLNEDLKFQKINNKISKCLKCNSTKFLLNDLENYSCPICDPNNNYIQNSLYLEENINNEKIFFFIFENLINLELIIFHLKELIEKTSKNDKFIIISYTNFCTIFYIEEDICNFITFNELSNFKYNKIYENNKESILNIIIPSLESFNLINNNL